MARLDLGAVRIEPLGPEHDRLHFACGVPALDRYFREQAGQDAKRRVAAPFVAVDEGRVIGFYTLSATSILLTEMPSELTKRMPHYPRVPGTLLGRLATDASARGVGLGHFLLVDAMHRAYRSEIASFAFVVDAIDEAAANFYQREGLAPLPGSPNRLIRRIADMAALFE